MEPLALAAGALFVLAGAITFVVAYTCCMNRIICAIGGTICVAWGVYISLLAMDVLQFSIVGVSAGQYALGGWFVIYMGSVWGRTRK